MARLRCVAGLAGCVATVHVRQDQSEVQFKGWQTVTTRKSTATPRFLDALAYAVQLHGEDVRKGTTIPYVAHLLNVCSLVFVDGGSEDEAIAALLHDALEDHPEEASRELVDQRFGHEVLAIVEACTDT